MKIRIGMLAAVLLSMMLGTAAQAALQTRLGGLAVYDSDLDVTWLVDANLAQSESFDVSGILADGRMTWDKANEWIAAMNAAGYLGYADWRLPIVVDAGLPGCDSGYDGGDCGFNVDQAGSEMAHLYHGELGNLAYFDTNGAPSGCGDAPAYCLVNTGPFANLQPEYYWSGTAYPVDADAGDEDEKAWYFYFAGGNQDATYKNYGLYVLALRSGDSAADAPVVPVPGALWLFGSALGLVGLLRRRMSA